MSMREEEETLAKNRGKACISSANRGQSNYEKVLAQKAARRFTAA